MQVKEISILDYGLGNIFSINQSFKNQGFKTNLIKTPEEMKKAETLILPGVGTFGVAMNYLRKNNLDEAVKAHVNTGKPLVGICLGMQLLFESSTEHGFQEGLGLVKGTVEKFKPIDDIPMRIPHIGWNKVKLEENYANDNKHQLYSSKPYFYFVHSYFATPINRKDVLLTSEYAGHEFCAGVKHENIIGFQFHPENSAQNGQNLIKYLPLLF